MANNNHLYSDFETKLNTLVGRTTEASADSYDHWRTLQQAKAEHDNMRIEQGLKFELDAFQTWLESTYGLRIHRSGEMIGQTYEVVDEQKFLVYKLKFV